MCIDINVSLPTVNKFLLLYSLRSGSVAIIFWTIFRTFICSILIMIFMIPEVFTGGKEGFFHYPMSRNEFTGEGYIYTVYLIYVVLLLTQVILLVYSLYSLEPGVHYELPVPIRHYLVCWFFTWLLELSLLCVLTIIHSVMLGWYLLLLMIIILEFYGFFVVFSYYRELSEEYIGNKASCESAV